MSNRYSSQKKVSQKKNAIRSALETGFELAGPHCHTLGNRSLTITSFLAPAVHATKSGPAYKFKSQDGFGVDVQEHYARVGVFDGFVQIRRNTDATDNDLGQALVTNLSGIFTKKIQRGLTHFFPRLSLMSSTFRANTVARNGYKMYVKNPETDQYGCCGVFAVITEKEIVFSSLGDCRLYHSIDQKYFLLTRDDAAGWRASRYPIEPRGHNFRVVDSRILHAFGLGSSIAAAFRAGLKARKIALSGSHQRFLLCSDGFAKLFFPESGVIDDFLKADVVSLKERVLEKLETLWYGRHSSPRIHDDMSAVLIEVQACG